MSAYDLAKIEARARIVERDYADSREAHTDEHTAACDLLHRVVAIALPLLPAIDDRIELGPPTIARGLRVHGGLVLTTTGLLAYDGAVSHPNLTTLSVPDLLAAVRTIAEAIDRAGSRRGAATEARSRAAKLRALVALLA